ncbi:glycoside hydrolase family 65 protein [Pseudoclavibacter endophyticus]|uniref:Glycoside hydrolase family 65 protein n=2 Tax=Pseudoclavibacter endophyticus TaxID=1778590 RepID=A0A6H9WV87_9MICO|nr:glycoside hydrolase family 65 protein [Pseudoclavibacter endophyticus]
MRQWVSTLPSDDNWFDEPRPRRAVEPGDDSSAPDPSGRHGDAATGDVPDGDGIDRLNFPVDEWALVERHFDRDLQGRTETIFTVANGYIGMRGNSPEGRYASEHGTYINGFHETWPIRHAEEAFGFARVGQTIVNVPDAKIIRLYVDDEPFVLATAEIESYERRLDFRKGIVTRDLVWRTPGGKRVRIYSSRLVSFSDRHLALLEYEVEVLGDEASVVFSSQLLNRQDGVDEYRSAKGSKNGGNSFGSGADERFDPRQAEQFVERVLDPRIQDTSGDRIILGYQTRNSGMTIACAVDHRLTINGVDVASDLAALDDTIDVASDTELAEDLAKRVYRMRARADTPIKLTKYVSYHTASSVPTRELADRCNRTLDRALDETVETHRARQLAWLEQFWESSDVVLRGQPDLQQAMRWNLFQLAQASARGDGLGIAAKGVTGSGYGGHYFWDTEVFMLPFLTYTQPQIARNALRFRHTTIDAARERAAELNERGALFPWRTINGEESSAYYAASTAQYHIDADISHAIAQYVAATGDTFFLINEGMDVLVETARMWSDLGFWRRGDAASFHVHGVTGPDEYTTVVNDNLFTNVMAQENLQIAADAVEWLRSRHPDDYDRLAARLDLREDELGEWRRAARHMHIPYDENLGVHPQDASFLDKEVWDLDHTPDEQRPLLLHFHPLVIYRFQVIKQADVVLALLLRGDCFTAEEKLRNFEYYDVLTTGDSSLSAVVQSIVAAEVGHMRLALKYFRHGAFVDLGDLHGNTNAGVHVASAGGMWMAAVNGFAGMRDHRGIISFDPRLPDGWQGIDFKLRLRDSRIRVELRTESIAFTLESGDAVRVQVRGETVTVEPGEPRIVPLAHQGERRTRELSIDTITGAYRSDGSPLTASVPVVTGAIPIGESSPVMSHGAAGHPLDHSDARSVPPGA